MARSSRSTAAAMPSIKNGSCKCAGSGLRNAKASAACVMPRATSSSATTSGSRASRASAAAASELGSAKIQRWRGKLCCACAAQSSTPDVLLILVVVRVRVVDHDVVETFEIFKQRLVALVPLGGGFVHEDDALVDEAELNIAELAGVFAQPLGLDHLCGLIVGEVHLAGFLDESVKLFVVQR